MPSSNPSPKLAITIDPNIHQKILEAATREGASISAWMSNPAREALQRQAGLASIAEREKQHVTFSENEMDEARRAVRAQLKSTRKVRRLA